MSAKSSKLWRRRGDPLGRTPRPITSGASPAVLRKSPSHFSKGKYAHSSTWKYPLEDESALEIKSPLILPPTTCTRINTPCQATFALLKINSLLQYVTPGSIVAFDIDDTLVMRRNYGSALLSSEGLRQFQLHIQQNMRSVPFAEKQELMNRLHSSLKDFVLAESETAEVVKALQSRGCHVFGLTARSPSIAHITQTSLRDLGIDLSLTAPTSLPSRAIETETGAAVLQGIVYCGTTDKGVVLQRLLQLGWLSWPSRSTANTTHCNANANAINKTTSTDPLSDDEHPSSTPTPTTNTTASITGVEPHEHTEDGKKCPERTIWFVDDSLPMIVGMMQAWTGMTQTYKEMYASLGEWASHIPCTGKLSLVCCHYTHPTAVETARSCADQVNTKLNDIIQYQIQAFIKTGEILSNADALRGLAEATPTPVESPVTPGAADVAQEVSTTTEVNNTPAVAVSCMNDA